MIGHLAAVAAVLFVWVSAQAASAQDLRLFSIGTGGTGATY